MINGPCYIARLYYYIYIYITDNPSGYQDVCRVFGRVFGPGLPETLQFPVEPWCVHSPDCHGRPDHPSLGLSDSPNAAMTWTPLMSRHVEVLRKACGTAWRTAWTGPQLGSWDCPQKSRTWYASLKPKNWSRSRLGTVYIYIFEKWYTVYIYMGYIWAFHGFPLESGLPSARLHPLILPSVP